ncbi:STAS domain-containing protein [Herbidospora yilanensis]|uniref:STAS domain-containing protein n=1 Tax=Herbidospora yilanensis TaxID=354426 RepID=UPI00078305D4|nr:STAS domain-containing protein [Herbidospora yilanensis]
MHLAVDITDIGQDTVIMSLVGELDMFTQPVVEATLIGLHARNVTRVVVAAAGLTFSDLGGMLTLCRADEQLRGRGGGLTLAAPARQVLRINALLATEGLRVFRSVSEALGVRLARHSHRTHRA